jgi:hypothetical protein
MNPLQNDNFTLWNRASSFSGKFQYLNRDSRGRNMNVTNSIFFNFLDTSKYTPKYYLDWTTTACLQIL